MVFMNKDFLKKKMIKPSGETFYKKVINELAKKETKNWIDLWINFNNLLFVVFIIFSRD